MAAETPTSGLYMSVSGVHLVAAQLDDSSSALHGHADRIARAVIPVGAFGAAQGLGSEYESVRQSLESAIRSSAYHVAGNGTHVRTNASIQSSDDNSGGARISVLRQGI